MRVPQMIRVLFVCLAACGGSSTMQNGDDDDTGSGSDAAGSDSAMIDAPVQSATCAADT